MAKPIEVGYAKFRDDLFINGKNFGKAIDKSDHRHTGVEMVYDREEKEMIVSWMGRTAHIPSTNVAVYCPGPAMDRRTQQIAHAMVAGISGAAQVETPFGHVHAGPGKGKSK